MSMYFLKIPERPDPEVKVSGLQSLVSFLSIFSLSLVYSLWQSSSHLLNVSLMQHYHQLLKEQAEVLFPKNTEI